MLGRSYAALMALASFVAPGIHSANVAERNAAYGSEALAAIIPDLEAARPTGNSGTGFKVTHLISPRYQRDLHFGRRDVHNAAWRQWAKLKPL